LSSTKPPFIYCNLAEFVGIGVQALFCDSTTIANTHSVFTTFTGQTGRSLTPYVGPAGLPSTISFLSSSSNSSASTTDSSTPSSSSTVEELQSSEPVTSVAPSTSSQMASKTQTTKATTTPPAQTSASATPSPTAAPEPSKAGSIVGGIFGTFAALALIGALVWYYLKRKREASQTGIGPNSQASAPYFPKDKTEAQVIQTNAYYGSKPSETSMPKQPQQAYGQGQAIPLQTKGPLSQSSAPVASFPTIATSGPVSFAEEIDQTFNPPPKGPPPQWKKSATG
jgi:hypothetical protein